MRYCLLYVLCGVRTHPDLNKEPCAVVAGNRLAELSQSPVQVAVATLSITNTARSDFSGNSAAVLALKSAIRDQINSVYAQSGATSSITVDDVNILGFDESAQRVRRLVCALAVVLYLAPQK